MLELPLRVEVVVHSRTHRLPAWGQLGSLRSDRLGVGCNTASMAEPELGGAHEVDPSPPRPHQDWLSSPNWRLAVLLLIVACIAAIPRFGQRENETNPTSDSDYYLDMAEVFAGARTEFNPEYVAGAAHHYNRPALPFLAGNLGRLIGDKYRAAFSLLDILGALLIAWILYVMALRKPFELKFAWAIPILFLTAFPQMDWGYHILTDTFGYATALAATVYAVGVLESRQTTAPPSTAWFALQLSLLFGLQSIAFLTCETAWFTVVVVSFLVVIKKAYRSRQTIFTTTAVIAVILIAKLPHAFYTSYFDLHGVPIKFDPSQVFNPWYIGDFLVKTGVAFNIAWIPALILAMRRQIPKTPVIFIGWAVAGILYMGAGYLHNDPEAVGYPLRLSFALFPVVYFWCASWMERVWRPRTWMVVAAVSGAYLLNLAGLLLDPANGAVHLSDLI